MDGRFMHVFSEVVGGVDDALVGLCSLGIVSIGIGGGGLPSNEVRAGSLLAGPGDLEDLAVEADLDAGGAAAEHVFAVSGNEVIFGRASMEPARECRANDGTTAGWKSSVGAPCL